MCTSSDFGPANNQVIDNKICILLSDSLTVYLWGGEKAHPQVDKKWFQALPAYFFTINFRLQERKLNETL